jgi:HAD superfamily hydrolase (TIGR01509 family)
MVAYVMEQHIPCAIASSSSRVVIDATLRQQGWDSLFAIRCSAEDELHGKPAPDVYLRAAERLGIAPQECLALEDSLTGAKAAVAAGMVCYAVPDLTHTTAEAFAGVTPYIFGSLLEVLENLNSTP